jgi:hypothetical protein
VSVDLVSVAVVISAAVLIATIARFAQHATWTRWFEVCVALSFCGLVALLFVGFVTASPGGD